MFKKVLSLVLGGFVLAGAVMPMNAFGANSSPNEFVRQRAIAGGGVQAVFALRDDGTLWTWGNRIFVNRVEHEQLLMPTMVMENVRAGNGLTVLRTDGTLWDLASTPGEPRFIADRVVGFFGNLREAPPNINPINISDLPYGHIIILREDESVWAAGNNTGARGAITGRATFTA